MNEFPVAIIGGGPTGLACALCLARAGARSVVLERHASTAVHPQAHVVNTRSMELFSIWGIAERVTADAFDPPATSGSPRGKRKGRGRIPMLDRAREAADVTAENRREMDRMLEEDRALRPLLSPVQITSCAQDRIEVHLLEALSTYPQADIRFGHRVSALRQHPEGVELTVETDRGNATIRADYCVAADGARSGTRKLLKIDMVGEHDLGTLMNVYFLSEGLVDCFAQGVPLVGPSLSEDSPGTFIGMDGRRRWVFNFPLDDPSRQVTEDECADRVRRAAMGQDSLDIDVISMLPWKMTAHVAERLRDGRVFLAGDAGHAFPPTGGFGMNTGLQDAHNLAWKLAAVYRGEAGPRLLDTYERERLPVAAFNAAQSLRNSGRRGDSEAVRALDGLSSTAVVSTAAHQASPAMCRFVALREHFGAIGMDLGFAYQDSPAIVGDDSPPLDIEVSRYVPNARPGARFPHLWLERDEGCISTIELVDGALTLMTGTGGRDAWTEAAKTLERVSVRVLAVGEGGDYRDLEDRWSDVADIESDGAILVRPDGHVAWRAATCPDDPVEALQSTVAVILQREAL